MKTVFYFIALIVILNIIFLQKQKNPIAVETNEYKKEKIKVLKKYNQSADHIKITKDYKKNTKSKTEQTHKINTIKNISRSKWNYTTSISPLDDSKRVSAYLRADQPIYFYGKALYPRLVISCVKKKTEAYINWGKFISLQDTVVSTRVNKERVVSQKWQPSRDGIATFAPSGYSFAKRLSAKNGELVVRVAPLVSSDVTTFFDINGFAEAIQPIREECGW